MAAWLGKKHLQERYRELGKEAGRITTVHRVSNTMDEDSWAGKSSDFPVNLSGAVIRPASFPYLPVRDEAAPHPIMQP